MNSQEIISAIAGYRSKNDGETPALLIVDGLNVECINYATLVQRSNNIDNERICDEYRVFVVNYTIQDFYLENFPVLVNKYTKTNIKDFLFHLLESETRP